MMDQAIEKMKHLSYFAEDVAGNGLDPRFEAGKVDMSKAIAQALQKALENLQGGLGRHQKLQKDNETQKHAGFVINLDLTVQQEEYQAAEIKDWLKKK